MSGGLGFGGGKNVSMDAPAIASIRIQTSIFGKPIALAYGQTRVPGNLIWYNDFRAIPHTSKQSTGGKGGGGSKITTTTYTYQVAALMGLVEGPIASIPAVWADKKQFTLAALGLSAYLGTTSQTADSYVTSTHPGEALGYRQLAYVGSGAYDLGDSATLPNHNFEIKALLPFSGSIVDANPAAVLNDYLTNAAHGAGYPSAALGSLTAMADYCTASNLFISPAYTEQQQASETITQLAQIANCALVYSEGLLKVIPFGDAVVTANSVTFTPNVTPVYALTDDDFLGDTDEDPIIVSRGNPADAFNQVQVKFYNRANAYNEDVAEAKDQANIEIYGLRPMQPVTLHEICDAVVARAVAQLILQRALYIRNRYKFTLGWKYCLLEPMDIVTLTESSGDGLDAVPVRIIGIEESEGGELEIEAEEFPGTIASSIVYPSQQPGGYSVNYNAAPGHINTPVIFDAAGRDAVSGYEVWAACAGSNALWGGAVVWASTDGATYQQVGTVYGRARYGVLSATFATGTDPDTTNTCAVDLTTSQGELLSGIAADADLANTLCWCEGELFAYQTATLTSAYHYNLLTYLRRGVYGTGIAAHSSGAPFVRLDSALLRYAYDPALIGTTLYLKFCSFNIWGGGTEALADVTAYSHLISGPIGAPRDVSGMAATITNDGILLTWSPVPDPYLAEYEVRETNSGWGDNAFLYRGRAAQVKVPSQASTGGKTWYFKALDQSGRYSINATSVALTVAQAFAPVVTAQVIDNNVLLAWSQPALNSTMQPIATYEIRRGATYAGADVIGTKSGLFTSVFETVAGAFVYWVTPIDIGGVPGVSGSVAAIVNQPPDFVFKNNYDSDLSGTLVNAVLDASGVTLPLDLTETFGNHFSGHSWATPAAQVAAGYPIYAQPALIGTGSYEETIDYGTTLASTKVTVSANLQVIAGSPTSVLTISAKLNIGDAWTDYVGVAELYLTNFRYLKIKIEATAAAGTDLLRIAGLNIRLDAKLKSDAGSVACVSTDNDAAITGAAAGGTTAMFAMDFASITSITLTAKGTAAPAIAIYDASGVADPVGFKIYLYDKNGNRISGTVDWAAKGY